MYKSSDKYIEASKKNSRSSKCKIIIEGKEYTGLDIIKSHPKIKHDAVKMIGEFPTKECQITLFNRDENNPIDVIGKKIEVYRGMILDDNTIEYIPQGIFVPNAEGVKCNSTAKTIEITMKDNSVVFDQSYEGTIEYPTTLGEFINEIITRRGLVLETPKFPFYDMVLLQKPNFDSSSTPERSLIAKAGELGGCTTQISKNGGVVISKPYDTGIKIRKTDYKRLNSKEKIFGPINSVVLGKTGINDDKVWRNQESIDKNGLYEWKIYDNPYVDLDRDTYIDQIGAMLDGMYIIPFEIENCIDNYLYDINDQIEIEDKFGKFFKTTIMSINADSRIFSKFKAHVQNKTDTNYKLAGSSKQDITKLRFDVDYNNKTIEAEIETNNEQSSQINQLSLDKESINLKVEAVDKKVEAVEGNINSTKEDLEKKIEENTTLIKLTAESITNAVQKSGGNNKIKNSVGLKGNEFWTLSEDADLTSSQDTETEQTTTSGSKFILSNGSARTDFSTIIGTLYSIAFKMSKKSLGIADNVSVELHRSEIDYDVIYEGSKDVERWEEISYSYTATVNAPYLIFKSNGDVLEFSDLIVSEGELQTWSQHSDEVYGKTQQLDSSGLSLSSLSTNETSKLNNNNLTFKEGSNITAELSKERILSNTAEIKERMKIRSLLIDAVDEDNYIIY